MLSISESGTLLTEQFNQEWRIGPDGTVAVIAVRVPTAGYVLEFSPAFLAGHYSLE